MVDYLGNPSDQHGGAPRIGVLLANLGTPDSPEPGPVRRFLAQFLSDPRVIEAPRWLWLPILHGVILRIRPSKSAHAYRQIWASDGSPLLTHSVALAKRIAASLQPKWNAVVALGMSYGSPSIAQALEELRRQGARRIIVLPLYPQYSGTTTASVFDRVTQQLQRWRWVPELRFIGDYHDDPGYIDAVAASIEQHWRTHQRGHLLFSFHGIPKRYVEAGDPYYSQNLTSARLIAERLSLDDTQWSVSFQSQVGREEWLRPYTDEQLLEYARSGPKRVTLVCPGFSTDCLETLEEIALRNRKLFLDAGGEAYDYVPALNASDAHVSALSHLLERHMQGWNDASPAANRETAPVASGIRR
jgi:ferrochelatase